MTKSSPFYISQGDFQQLVTLSSYEEAISIQQSLSNQKKASNLLRWSYKYNVLHRRSIHNSHKLTSAKRLLSLGYFDFNIADQNIWFSDQYGRNLSNPKKSKGASSHDILQTSWKLLYQTSLGGKDLNPSFFTEGGFSSIKDSFRRLSNYESSFFFFLKRTYLFAGLNSLVLPLSPALGNSSREGDSKWENMASIYSSISTLNSQTALLPLHEAADIQKPVYSKVVTSGDKDLVLVRSDKTIWALLNLNPLYNLTRPYNPVDHALLVFLYGQGLNNTHVLQNLTYSLPSLE